MKLTVSLCLLVLLTVCSKQRKFGNEVFEGHLYQDKISGAPAVGKTVSIEACNPKDGRNECATFSFGETTTDANGYFKIEGKPARSGRYFISTQGNSMKEPKEIEDYNQKNIKLYISH